MVQFSFQACSKPKFTIPVCDSNCIHFDITFRDSTNNSPFANQHIRVCKVDATGLGNSSLRLYDMQTNENGNIIFDESYNKLMSSKNNSMGNISFLVCGKGSYNTIEGSGNRVGVFLTKANIGSSQKVIFNFFK
jgi:hypothetical protein